MMSYEAKEDNEGRGVKEGKGDIKGKERNVENVETTGSTKDPKTIESSGNIGSTGNVTKWKAIRYDGTACEEMEDAIAAEFALTVMLNREEFATIVCSPTHIKELVFGFLASEGMIREAAQVKRLELDLERGFAHVELAALPSVSRSKVSKRFIGSCCGKSRQFYFYNDMLTARTVKTSLTLTASRCMELMEKLQAESGDFKSTGGVHNAALATGEGLLAVMTDIGRHNALDKLFGYALLKRIKTFDKTIVFSGRLSSEVVLKAAKIGCGILISKSAPTDLALRLAEDLGITCVGFVRGGSLSIYTHPRRIIINGLLP
ncbi:formate dehydrogenase accessory sulfurtransferase FdhD [Paenibacillus sp. GCM10027627]|uniref:formate dehydrogenase accessory sulfurtransferase FdhD n=1 Tax=unclassified Paenibacillus TaxID=185978 RepID=UPI003642AE2E